MKEITYILTILLLSIIPLYSAEKMVCSDLKKFSKAFVTCKSNNIKIGMVDTVYKNANDIKNYQKKTWSKKD